MILYSLPIENPVHDTRSNALGSETAHVSVWGSRDHDHMLLPITCYTCQAPIEHMWVRYEKLVRGGMQCGAAMDLIGISSLCCRRFFPTNVSDMADTVITLSGEGCLQSEEATEIHTHSQGMRTVKLR